jgi:biopolymer transport protein ExbB
MQKKKFIGHIMLFVMLFCCLSIGAEAKKNDKAVAAKTVATDTSSKTNVDSVPDDVDYADSLNSLSSADSNLAPTEEMSFHKTLKTKFIEGDAGFMSLVALALVLGLAFCIERIIYLSLSETNAKKFMSDMT